MREIEIKTSKTLSLGSDVVLRVLSVRGNNIQLGIEAPKEVPILRSELARRPQTKHSLG